MGGIIMPRKEHHLVPNSERGGWDVKRNSGDRSIKHFDTKEPAEKFGREVSRNQGTEFFIHDKHGKIIDRDSHGNDPKNRKG